MYKRCINCNETIPVNIDICDVCGGVSFAPLKKGDVKTVKNILKAKQDVDKKEGERALKAGEDAAIEIPTPVIPPEALKKRGEDDEKSKSTKAGKGGGKKAEAVPVGIGSEVTSKKFKGVGVVEELNNKKTKAMVKVKNKSVKIRVKDLVATGDGQPKKKD